MSVERAEDLASAEGAEPITRTTPFDDLPQWLTVAEAATYTGHNAWTIYANLHRGHIPYRRFGKRILIPKDFFRPDSAVPQVTGASL